MKKKIIFFIVYGIFFIITILLIPNEFKLYLLFIEIILLIIIICINNRKNKEKVIEVKIDKSKEEKNSIKRPENLPDNFDFDTFEEEIKELYKNIQKAFMDFDYEYLQQHLSEKLYMQYKYQMDNLKKNNSQAIRDNINYIDFIFNDFNDNKFNVSIGLYEDKYTKKRSEKKRLTGITYESYYELIIIKKDYLILDNLKLVYSHSKKS